MQEPLYLGPLLILVPLIVAPVVATFYNVILVNAEFNNCTIIKRERKKGGGGMRRRGAYLID